MNKQTIKYKVKTGDCQFLREGVCGMSEIHKSDGGAQTSSSKINTSQRWKVQHREYCR